MHLPSPHTRVQLVATAALFLSATPVFADAAKLELLDESASDTVFAYQFGLGGWINLKENLVFDLSYRYFATSDPNFDTTEAELASHNLMAGLRMDF